VNPRTLGRFTPDELGVLAGLLALARWPFPLQVRSSAPTEDALRRAELDAHERLTAGGVVRGGRVEPDLEGALRTLTRPAVQVDVSGFAGPDPADAVRILAAHAGGPGVLARQLPGPAEHVGGDVVITVLRRAALPAAVAGALFEALPARPPGRVGPLSVARTDLASAEGTSVTRSAARSPVEHARAQLDVLARGPFATGGQLAVNRAVPGGAEDRRCTLRWFDVDGDGRYLVDSSRGVDLTPGDEGTLTRALAAQLPR
jgi:hypothetical protein